MNFDVKFTNVFLKYGSFEALKNISFSLSSGTTYGLIGRNGAGKTSLLSLLASFSRPTSGTIRVGGEDPFENATIMSQVSFVYSTNYSEEDHPVIEYFEASKRYRPNFAMDYAKELAKQFNLPLNKPINKLSKGMQSALNAILGLASRSPVTIFDEVYLGMDAPTRKMFYEEVIKEQSQYPRVMILSTHLVSEMEYLFDHVLIIDHGTLIIDEDFETIINRGAAITGHHSEVDAFVSNKSQLNTEELGNVKSVMVYGEITNAERAEAQSRGIEIGTVSLQELFIYLTQKEDDHEIKK